MGSIADSLRRVSPFQSVVHTRHHSECRYRFSLLSIRLVYGSPLGMSQKRGGKNQISGGKGWEILQRGRGDKLLLI